MFLHAYLNIYYIILLYVHIVGVREMSSPRVGNPHAGVSASCLVTSEMYCTRLTEIQDAKITQKVAVSAPSHNVVGLYVRNALIDNRKKTC